MGWLSFKTVDRQQAIEPPQVRHRNLYTADQLALLLDCG